jgi:hypothetical protein
MPITEAQRRKGYMKRIGEAAMETAGEAEDTIIFDCNGREEGE